jgi:hypothetical protein
MVVPLLVLLLEVATSPPTPTLEPPAPPVLLFVSTLVDGPHAMNAAPETTANVRAARSFAREGKFVITEQKREMSLGRTSMSVQISSLAGSLFS